MTNFQTYGIISTMISIDRNAKIGDLVYAWFSPFPESSKNKRPTETEYRLGENTENRLKLDAPNGGYSVIFGKEMIETWHGNVKKAK